TMLFSKLFAAIALAVSLVFGGAASVSGQEPAAADAAASAAPEIPTVPQLRSALFGLPSLPAIPGVTFLQSIASPTTISKFAIAAINYLRTVSTLIINTLRGGTAPQLLTPLLGTTLQGYN